MAEKRAGDDPAESPAQAKRLKPMDELSEDGPLTQRDVVYFKKEAIWRQMRAYKTKCNALMADMDRLQRQYHDSETKVNILDAWYEQIINQLDFAAEKSERDLTHKINKPKTRLTRRRIGETQRAFITNT